MRILALFLLLSFYSSAADTTKVVTDSVKPHSVRKAVIFSAVVPGLGQIYNHRAMPKGKKKAFWKVPLIYAGLGASTYFLIYNQNEVNQLRREYSSRQYASYVDGSTYTGVYSITQFDDTGVLTLHSQHQRWRDLSILAVGIVYLLQVVDAGVEAHFVDFDISEDLSMSFRPTFLDRSTPGLSVRLNFR